MMFIKSTLKLKNIQYFSLLLTIYISVYFYLISYDDIYGFVKNDGNNNNSQLHNINKDILSNFQIKEKLNQAIKYYDNALATNPNATDILNNKGLALLHLEKYDEALKVFDKSLSINSKFAPSLYNKGVALDKLGNHTQAQYYQQKALEINPKYKGDFINRLSIISSLSLSTPDSIAHEEEKGEHINLHKNNLTMSNRTL